eukprot:258934-Prymnesium_polylepis.1
MLAQPLDVRQPERGPWRGRRALVVVRGTVPVPTPLVGHEQQGVGPRRRGARERRQHRGRLYSRAGRHSPHK